MRRSVDDASAPLGGMLITTDGEEVVECEEDGGGGIAITDGRGGDV